MATAGDLDRGAVFTQQTVVEFILDLAGYTVDQPLHQFRMLEPSFGQGDFLLIAVDRLLASYGGNLTKPRPDDLVRDLSDAVRAVELHPDSIEKTRSKLTGLMEGRGVDEKVADLLLNVWIMEGDFLLVDLPHRFTHIVGNPPYVRQERIPDALMTEYRARYASIYDRADIYVPFIERSLTSLDLGGRLAFICSDRWMKNRYGGPLRAMVARDYHLACYIDMVDTPAFQTEVTAYPAITLIAKEKPGPTRIVHRPRIDAGTFDRLTKTIGADILPKGGDVLEIPDVATGEEPWILHSSVQLSVVRRLEMDFPALEKTGCNVGIGVATGADKVFIGPYDDMDVEPDRKLPLVKTKDIKDGVVAWQGLGVINPFADDGTLIDLGRYPKLSAYFSEHEATIRKRHCAKKNRTGWYRTIDRIYPDLMRRPKLLIPDIKGEAHVVYEDGHLYPHHNLYYITSDQWDLQALRAVLLSGIAKLFVSLYSVQMRGGYFRFQAQNLRRIRLPLWEDVPRPVRAALKTSAEAGNIEACSRAAFDLYRLTQEERAVIGGNVKAAS